MLSHLLDPSDDVQEVAGLQPYYFAFFSTPSVIVEVY